jgi:glycosyltransferase involved in cell wall biosynthesis
MNKLLIYIVSYQRKEYTQGNIINTSKIAPQGSKMIICDNGSTDGTREWLKQNQEKYNLKLLFPDKNLRVAGAWTLLAQQFSANEFDYILVLDNDHWMIPHNKNWFKECLKIYNLDKNIGSLGLLGRRKPGWFGDETKQDPSFENRKTFNNQEYYSTIFYAGCRLDKFSLWHQTMKGWNHQFIGDTLGRAYRSLGYNTLKLNPGYALDISQYTFDNPSHEEYNKWFFKKERSMETYRKKLERTPRDEDRIKIIKEKFGQESLSLLFPQL